MVAPELIAEVTELRARCADLESQVERLRRLYLQTLEQVKKLERGIIGPKTEKAPPHPAQLTLDVLGTLLREHGADPDAIAAAAEQQSQRVKKPRQKPTGRKPLPAELPRVDIEVLPPEVEQEGLAAFDRIGEEVSEVVERRPASLVVVRVVRPKFVRKGNDLQPGDDSEAAPAVLVGEPCELPIPKGLAGPGLLADTIVRRLVDHTPLYRLESVYARDGLPLARSTICTWHDAIGDLVAPLVEAMFDDAMSAPYVCVDATGVLVQAKIKCRRAHFWVLVAPDRHVLFRYTRKHDIRAVDRVLAGYKGYLVADAATVYDHLFAGGDVVEVGCWAHARRYFFKALDSEPELARQALDLIGSLFGIERDVAEAARKKREAARDKRSRPIVRTFFAWCVARSDEVLDDTPIARAINYAVNQRAALERFLEDGRLPMHNNISEGNLRRIAVGRKNWLFLGSDDGGRTNARLTSLLASCQMHRIEPLGYLRDLLILLPAWPRSRVLELAPCCWQQTLQQEHAQQLLAASRLRRIALGVDVGHQPEG